MQFNPVRRTPKKIFNLCTKNLVKKAGNPKLALIITPFHFHSFIPFPLHLLNHQPFFTSIPSAKTTRLESRVSVLEQLLKVSLEPLASLRGRLESIRETAVEVIAGSGGVGGTVGLATGLDPDEGVGDGGAGVGGGAGAEAGADGVAPVTLLDLARGLHAGAARVDDELGGEAGGVEQRGEGLDEALLIVVGVGGGVRGSRGERPAVVVGHVGDETTDRLGLTGVLVDVGEEGGGGPDVGGPAEPATVASVEVLSNVGEVELGDGVVGALLVGGGGVGALGNVSVGDKVGKRVGLDDEDGTDVRVLDEELADGVDVGLVVIDAVVGEGELAVGGGSSAVTVGEIVDNEVSGIGRVGTGLVGSADLLEGALHESVNGDVAVEPLEGRDLGNGRGLSGPGASHGRNGMVVDLGGVVAVGPALNTDEGVASEASSGGSTASNGGGGHRGSGGGDGLVSAAGGDLAGGAGDLASAGRAGGRSLGGGGRTGQALEVVGVDLRAVVARGAASRARPANTTALAPI